MGKFLVRTASYTRAKLGDVEMHRLAESCGEYLWSSSAKVACRSGGHEVPKCQSRRGGGASIDVGGVRERHPVCLDGQVKKCHWQVRKWQWQYIQLVGRVRCSACQLHFY
ncbi:hypothetical protein BKA93DRAFT_805347 [Sparassis latifolia]